MKYRTGNLIRSAVIALAAICACTPLVHAAEVAPASNPESETKEQRDARMGWWRQAKFGMFIHWGIYSVPAGTFEGKKIGDIGEWIMNTAKIPVARYAQFAKDFTGDKFNAEQWAGMAPAGVRAILTTVK